MNMFPYLKENLVALEKRNKVFYAWLSHSAIDEQALRHGVFHNSHGIIDWRMKNGRGLFETVPPGPLYHGWAKIEKPDVSATFVVGTNVGYGLNYLLVNTPDTHKVLVLEPDPALALACLGQTDYRPFFENKKLHFLPPDENVLAEVIKHLDLQYIYGRIYLRADVPSRQIGPIYAQWMRLLKGRLDSFGVEMSTLRCRQDVMVGNELKNYRRSLKDGSLQSLKSAADGVAAVILGAGPSLAQHAPELASDPGDALYVSALQTLPALAPYGLKPHFCLALDYDDSMLELYDRLDRSWAADIPLIYSTKVNPELLRRYPGPTLPLWTMGGMATFALKDREFVLDAGGNVSLTLVRLLRWMDAASILLVGQDFAWKGETTHAAGHHASGHRVTFDPALHEKLKNLRGEEIISSVQYLAAKRDLEDDIKKSPFRIRNLYGGGVDIKGAPPVTLPEARAQGLLSSAEGSRGTLLDRLAAAHVPCRGIEFEPRSPVWTSSIRHMEKRLLKLLRHHTTHQQDIHTLLEQALIFVRQDPLYLPYLFNETIDLAGLAKTRRFYSPGDFTEFRRIGKSIISKVREVDRCVGLMDEKHAA